MTIFSSQPIYKKEIEEENLFDAGCSISRERVLSYARPPLCDIWAMLCVFKATADDDEKNRFHCSHFPVFLFFTKFILSHLNFLAAILTVVVHIYAKDDVCCLNNIMKKRQQKA
jgi:hypothetical protein